MPLADLIYYIRFGIRIRRHVRKTKLREKNLEWIITA